jgi:carbonic anhydrase/acetyltransferase-like protein (isoleucine patch superfamily)
MTERFLQNQIPSAINLPRHRMVRVGDYYQATTAVVCGDVEVGKDCSIWFGATIRGDVASIRLGKRVNVQENSVLHCDSGVPLEIGDDVTIGHGAIVHCAKVEEGALIGMGAVVLGSAVIGKNAMVAAGCVVSPNTVVPEGMVVMGVPGKVVRAVRPEELENTRKIMLHYVELAREHADMPEKFYGK